MVKPTTVRLLLSLDLLSSWVIHQLDVHNTFLNGNLAKTVHMCQPPGNANKDYHNHVCLLHHSLYGLKQAPWAWITWLHDFLISVSFCSSKTDLSFYLFSGFYAGILACLC